MVWAPSRTVGGAGALSAGIIAGISSSMPDCPRPCTKPPGSGLPWGGLFSFH